MTVLHGSKAGCPSTAFDVASAMPVPLPSQRHRLLCSGSGEIQLQLPPAPPYALAALLVWSPPPPRRPSMFNKLMPMPP